MLRGIRITGGIAALMALFAVVPATSSAAHKGSFTGKRTIARSGPVAGHMQSVTVTARCPRGMTAVSGGFEVPPATSSVIPLVYESIRSGDRGWRISAQLDDPGASDTVEVTAYVNCFKRVPRILTGSSEGTSVGTFATAACPMAGETKNFIGVSIPAISGGFTAPKPVGPAGYTFVIGDSGRLSGNFTGWATGVEIPYAASIEDPVVHTEAYCINKLTGAPRGDSSKRAATGTSTARATCNHGTKGIGGGFTTYRASDFGTVAIPFSSRLRADGSWTMGAARLQSGGVSSLFSGRVAAKVTCAKD